MILSAKSVNIQEYANRYCRRKIFHFGSVSSTQIIARNLAKKGESDKTVVTASSQFCGRGRMDRVWESSPDRGLYFSMILRPGADSPSIPQLSLLTAVALVNTIRNITGLNVSIKWPNDIMYANKKICGILSEAMFNNDATEYVIVGVGVNTNQSRDDFTSAISDTASSLYINTEKKIDHDELLHVFLDVFDYWYNEWQLNGVVRIINTWNKYNCTIGRNITLLDNGNVMSSGLAVAIDREGCLVVKNNNGSIMSFDYGEVSARID